MAFIPPDFLDSVIAIGKKNENNETVWIGTGFIYGKLSLYDENLKGKMYKTFLITNKHVIKNLSSIVIRLNPLSDFQAEEYELPLNLSDKKIVFEHPDSSIDVVAIPLNVNKLKERGMKYCFFRDEDALTKNGMKKNGVSEGDFIYVLGYPMGFVSDKRQNVTVRMGIISRIRDLYEDCLKDFIIDSSVFPGNSGGPVILKPEICSVGETKTIESAYIIGMVKSYIPYRDIAISEQTQRARIIFEEHSGLSNVIPMDYIDETILFGLKERGIKLEMDAK